MEYGLDKTVGQFQNYANGQSYGTNIISQGTANAYIQRGTDNAHAKNAAYSCESGAKTEAAIAGMTNSINAAKDSANKKIQDNIDSANRNGGGGSDLFGFAITDISALELLEQLKALVAYQEENRAYDAYWENIRQIVEKGKELLAKGIQPWIVRNYVWNSMIEPDGFDYIKDQRYGWVSQMRYGDYYMSYNGCELISVYHAMLYLGRPQKLADIVFEFEINRGMMLGHLPGMFNSIGIFGTNPYILDKYFQKYNTHGQATGNAKTFESWKGGVYIVNYWNDSKTNIFGQKYPIVEKGIHAIMVTEAGGYYFPRNAYMGVEPDTGQENSHESFHDMMNYGKSKRLFIVGYEVW